MKRHVFISARGHDIELNMLSSKKITYGMHMNFLMELQVLVLDGEF